MPSDALQNVIEKLKDQGIKAAEVDAKKIKRKAERDAEEIITSAEAKAQSILERAREEERKIREQLNTELERASKIGLDAFKSAVEKALVVPTIEETLAGVLKTPQFLEKVIIEMVKGFAANKFKGADLTLLLPAELQKQLGSSIGAKMKMMAGGGDVQVTFDDSIRFGFKIGPSQKGFVFDLSDEGFREIFTRFISPKFRELFVQK